jgi:hypothetical protein
MAAAAVSDAMQTCVGRIGRSNQDDVRNLLRTDTPTRGLKLSSVRKYSSSIDMEETSKRSREISPWHAGCGAPSTDRQNSAQGGRA